LSSSVKEKFLDPMPASALSSATLVPSVPWGKRAACRGRRGPAGSPRAKPRRGAEKGKTRCDRSGRDARSGRDQFFQNDQVLALFLTMTQVSNRDAAVSLFLAQLLLLVYLSLPLSLSCWLKLASCRRLRPPFLRATCSGGSIPALSAANCICRRRCVPACLLGFEGR
jgi:hypothetical protein